MTTLADLGANVDHAALAYKQMAPTYEAFTAMDDYDRWVDLIEELAAHCGIATGRALDIATGTGKVAGRLSNRGWNVTASDISDDMLAIAARNPNMQGVALHQADMRVLPDLGVFDLVTCIDDAINYILSWSDLVEVLTQMKLALRTNGVAVFDVNTLRTYQTFYATTTTVRNQHAVMVWIGHNQSDFSSGDVAKASLEIFTRGDTGWNRSTAEHTQKHYSISDVTAAIARAGLELVMVRALGTTGYLEQPNSPGTQHKHLFLVRYDGS